MKITFKTLNKTAAAKYNFNKGYFFMICPEYKNLNNSADFECYVNKSLSSRLCALIDNKISALGDNQYLLIDAVL